MTGPSGSEGGAAQLVYFHGMPGAPAELDWCGGGAARRFAAAPDRNRPGCCAPAALAPAITAAVPAGPLVLVGFSLGACAALQTAPLLGARVAALHLVSPAAPLQLGDFLPDMRSEERRVGKECRL